jgi:hypothetical protein
MFADDSDSPPVNDPAPTAVETKAIAESSNSNVNATADASASSGASAEVATDPTSPRQPESRGDKATQQSAAAKPPRTKPDEIIVDGETVYMGNTKITPDGTIETPDHIIDENGVTPRRPMPPNTRPVVIPPIDMRYMTPRQRRRLQETLRRHQVTMAPPTPTPEN